MEEAKKKMEEEKFHQKKSAEIKAEIEKLDQNITYFNQQEKKGDNLPDKKTTPSLLGCLHKDLGTDHVILTGSQMMNLVSNFECLF